MTTTKPAGSEWVTYLLAACTPSEQKAIKQYRFAVGKNHHKHRLGQLTRAQITKIWAKALDKLEAEACGSPKFDQYVTRQMHHFEEWVTGAATSGKSA